jgi:hypothetical protein
MGDDQWDWFGGCGSSAFDPLGIPTYLIIRLGRVRQPLSDFELSGAQRLILSSVGPFGLFLSVLICFFALRSGE